MRPLLFLSALVLASLATAQTQIPIPGYTQSFVNATRTRGFWFQSPGPIVITGLRVPNETNQTIQNVEVFNMPAAPPVWPASASGGQVFYSVNQPAGQIIPTSIPVQTGDIIGVLGACGTTMMANSQGTVGPFASSILGMPVNLERFLTQTNINVAGGNQPYSQEPGVPVVRVEVQYAPAVGLFPGFQANVTSGDAPLTVNFTDLSFTSDPAGILAWLWDFDNDGTIDSNLQNPTHVYTTRGIYDVSLTVIDGTNGAASEVKPAYMQVTLPTPSLQAVAEASPGAGALSGATPQAFEDGWDIRWNILDTTGSQTGLLSAIGANFGFGGSAPVGTTPSIPGFTQVWGGSTPAALPGEFDLFGLVPIGGPDLVATVPAGLFAPGDTVRFQGVMLDPSAGGGGNLPVLATPEVIEFVHRACAGGFEDFDSLATGTGSYPMGWANGGGQAEWSVNTGSTTSTATGPSGAVSGPNYMYCETSGPIAGRTFIMNTGVIPTAGLVGSLDFRLSRIGATIGTLEIRQGDGTGTFPTVLATYTGPEPNMIEWTNESLALQLAGLTNVQLQFNYAQGASFTGDIAIDDVCIN